GQHARNDRDRTVHHHPTDHCGDGRTASHDWLVPWGGHLDVRWSGVGRTRRGDARLGRLVPLSSTGFRTEPAGPSHEFSLYLADRLQRAFFDRLRRRGFRQVRWFFFLVIDHDRRRVVGLRQTVRRRT